MLGRQCTSSGREELRVLVIPGPPRRKKKRRPCYRLLAGRVATSNTSGQGRDCPVGEREILVVFLTPSPSSRAGRDTGPALAHNGWTRTTCQGAGLPRHAYQAVIVSIRGSRCHDDLGALEASLASAGNPKPLRDLAAGRPSLALLRCALPATLALSGRHKSPDKLSGSAESRTQHGPLFSGTGMWRVHR